MKKYIIIALNQATVNLQYKFNTAITFISRTIPIFMSYFLWTNIYKSMNGSKVGNYTKSQMVTYIILISLVDFLFTWKTDSGRNLDNFTVKTCEYTESKSCNLHRKEIFYDNYISIWDSHLWIFRIF